jgi:hypothetical protein
MAASSGPSNQEFEHLREHQAVDRVYVDEDGLGYSPTA